MPKRACILITESADEAINTLADKTGTPRARVVHEALRRKAADELQKDIGDYPVIRRGRKGGAPKPTK